MHHPDDWGPSIWTSGLGEQTATVWGLGILGDAVLMEEQAALPPHGCNGALEQLADGKATRQESQTLSTKLGTRRSWSFEMSTVHRVRRMTGSVKNKTRGKPLVDGARECEEGDCATTPPWWRTEGHHLGPG